MSVAGPICEIYGMAAQELAAAGPRIRGAQLSLLSLGPVYRFPRKGGRFRATRLVGNGFPNGIGARVGAESAFEGS